MTVKPYDVWWRRVRKTLVYVAGGAAQLVAFGLLHGDALHYAQLGLLIATGLGVYQVPNVARGAARPATHRRSRHPHDTGYGVVELVVAVILLIILVWVLFAVLGHR